MKTKNTHTHSHATKNIIVKRKAIYKKNKIDTGLITREQCAVKSRSQDYTYCTTHKKKDIVIPRLMFHKMLVD